MRVVVHFAGIQDRDGAVRILDKIRNRFPWFELVGADGGYDVHQVKDAVAGVPTLRMGIVKRGDDMKDFVVLPRRGVSSGPSHGSVETADWPRAGRASSRRCEPSSPVATQPIIRRFARR